MNLRLLPWTGEDGKPSYYPDTGQADSFISRLADNLESVQMGMAEDLLNDITEILAADALSETVLLNVIAALSSSLRDVIRVAESRGRRLAPPDADDDEPSRAADAVIDREIARRPATSSQAASVNRPL
ncbi:hypothetical protein OG552_15420 [Streptomyces sp. NBC_01476]|uniref:hypothetical protein n=1 Tax=Streptomyces sp. NBC_01476 TaxID=2903881 RepID=UPI002E3080DD|nr:hypothetical protein [Streptomyces sp. NBC_01476]